MNVDKAIKFLLAEQEHVVDDDEKKLCFEIKRVIHVALRSVNLCLDLSIDPAQTGSAQGEAAETAAGLFGDLAGLIDHYNIYKNIEGSADTRIASRQKLRTRIKAIFFELQF